MEPSGGVRRRDVRSSRAHHRDGIAVGDQRQRREYRMLAVCVESLYHGHPNVTLDALNLFRRIH